MFRPDDNFRVALVGKRSLVEDELILRLVEAGVEESSIVNFDESSRDTVLDMEDGENCRLYLPLAEEYLKGYNAVFLLSKDEKTRKMLTGLASSAKVPVFDAVNYSSKPGNKAAHLSDYFFIPPAEAVFFSKILEGSGSSEVKGFCWTVFRPAADLGKEGIEELFNQSRAVMNFKKPPLSVFGEQLAFNLLPAPPDPEGGVESAVRELCGFKGHLIRNTIIVPVFHGTSISFVMETGIDARSCKRNIEAGLKKEGGYRISKSLDAFLNPGHKGGRQLFLQALGNDRIWGWYRFDPARAEAELAVEKMCSEFENRAAGPVH